MTRVALLWHMHQPYYEDLVTREHIMPWARLHALKDYYGMVALLDEFPDVRMTFNMVPSLLVQIEAFAGNRARDRYLELSLVPADELNEADAAFVTANFFHAQRARMIDIYPRYAELLDLRGSGPVTTDTARRFDVADLRDLQVWQKLAWVDPLYHERDPRVQSLVGKGRGFTEEDKAVLREVELEILNAVIPAYRAAWAREQIEVSASPFYHPILPLLCDTAVYHRTHPGLDLSRAQFSRPEDALEQLGRASAYVERVLGRRPTGLWPSEGSVSDAMVPLVADTGFRWMATDEQILARTLGIQFTRDSAGHLEHAERLYAPYVVSAGGEKVACVFRDHTLSDLIGFVYASWPAEQAAADFVERLAEAGRRFGERSGGEEALIPVILDGENAWEHFEGGGRPFLRALYRRLSDHPELRTVTMGEACATATRELPGIFPGSWIDANFYIWIGHPDDRRAWGQLAGARHALDAVSDRNQSWTQAREEVFIAEGSDWFWWYGDDHSSEHDPEFDELFRRHLRNVYALLDRPVPDDLFASNISTGAAPPAEIEPVALLNPTIDGRESSYFEWLGAGRYEVRQAAGAMHRADQAQAVVRRVVFGFDPGRLFVRIDPERRADELLAEGYEFSLKFLEPPAVRFSVKQSGPALVGSFWVRGEESNGEARWTQGAATESRSAAGEVLEIALPWSEIDGAGSRLAFFVAVYSADGRELERHPSQYPIQLDVPNASFEARQWSV